MLLREIIDPKLLMKRPRNAVLNKSHGIDKPLFNKQSNKAKPFAHFKAKSD